MSLFFSLHEDTLRSGTIGAAMGMGEWSRC
jgi:hypothetical protein